MRTQHVLHILYIRTQHVLHILYIRMQTMIWKGSVHTVIRTQHALHILHTVDDDSAKTLTDKGSSFLQIFLFLQNVQNTFLIKLYNAA